MLNLQMLRTAVDEAAAIRRRRRLQPVGGAGDKLFPPTYPGDNGPQHVFEVRRIGSEDVVCVLLDSVQSQANRLEEALLDAATAGRIRLPRLVVDFPSAGLNSVPAISSLEAPHRVFDAILRDSELDGVAFGKSELGLRLKQARPHNATALLECSPNSLLFGVWNSTGEGGGLGAKFARAIVSEIVAVRVPSEQVVDRRSGEVSLRTSGRRTGSRVDPLGIVRSVEVWKSESGWDTDAKAAGGKAKKVRPSEINHGNIAPSIDNLGITCDYAEQTAVITFAGLRRLRFGGTAEQDSAARTYLAALGLVALAELDAAGYALRSRCDLVCDGDAPLELAGADGTSRPLSVDRDAATELHEAAFDAALAAGFELDPAPRMLMPAAKLVRIVEESQRRALHDESDGGDA